MRVEARAGRGAVAWTLAMALAVLPGGADGQLLSGTGATVDRPVPAPVVPSPFFRAGLDAGTRAQDGRPGPAYWRNEAHYEIDAALDPATGRLTGREAIRYRNRSPDTLDAVFLHLHQNLHAEGVVRNEPQEITGGVDLTEVRVAGRAAPEFTGDGGGPARPPLYQVQGTLMAVALAEPLVPGGEVELEIGWEVLLPQSGAGRMGWSEREMYFVAYWFPKIAVYDDLRGWDAEPYQGGAEFYDEFGTYDVRLTVPEGWTVMATGELQNPEEVLTPEVRSRLDAAATADTVVPVVTVDDLEAGRATADAPEGEATLTWRFTAPEVRDFAWSASNAQRWDATSARVPDRDGDGREERVLIHSFWRPDRAPLWEDQALYGKHAVEHHSTYTGYTYPWSHMTSVEGADIIGGGMEFPMMTVIGPYQGSTAEALYNVTSHEIAHMWIPMIVGTNEKRHAWMDEGSTTFLENQGRPEYWPGTEAHSQEMTSYLGVARAELEQPLMRHGDYYEPGPGYGVASYPKPASLLVTLRTLLGEEAFLEGYRSFIDAWAFAHPTPWDFFNAFERVAGQDLDWFWSSFYFETWTLDHAVASVEQATGDAGPRIEIEDRGWAVFPARVVVETSAGGTLERVVPVSTWLSGDTRAVIALPASVGRVERVRMNPGPHVPDVSRENDVWTRGGG